MKILNKNLQRIIFIVYAVFFFYNSAYAQNSMERRPSKVSKTETGIQDPKAHKILQEVKKWYLSSTSRQVFFSYQLLSNKKEAEKYKGNIIISGNKFIMKLLSQEIFCDGKTVWNYLSEENEVSIHSYDPKDEINPLDAIIHYEDKFRLKYIRQDASEGKMRNILDLIPTTSSNFHKIRLFTNLDDHKIHLIECYEKSGNVLKYKIDKYIENVNLPAEAFSFQVQKYKNIQVNDFRY